jgi:1-phosphofructokinase
VIVTVTTNPSLDRTYATGPVALGEVNRARYDTVEASGKGVNISRALHAAGIATVAVLTAGGSEGDQLRALLDRDGLPYVPIDVPGATRTNVTIAASDRTTKVNSVGQPLTTADHDTLTAVVAAQACHANWVVLSGSVPPGAERDLLPRLLAAAREAGARTAVDTSGDALVAAADAAPDLLAPNADELSALTGRRLPGGGHELVGEALAAATGVVHRTGSAMLVSLGAVGALWVSGDGRRALHAVAPPITPINTVGAGDALLAGWLALTPATGTNDGGEGPAGQLARAVAWGTAACLLPGTAGDVSAAADTTAVTVTDLAVPMDFP